MSKNSDADVVVPGSHNDSLNDDLIALESATHITPQNCSNGDVVTPEFATTYYSPEDPTYEDVLLPEFSTPRTPSYTDSFNASQDCPSADVAVSNYSVLQITRPTITARPFFALNQSTGRVGGFLFFTGQNEQSLSRGSIDALTDDTMSTSDPLCTSEHSFVSK